MADMRRKGIDMTISKKQDEKELVIFIEGRLDSTTAPALDMEVKALDGVESLVFDLEKLEYISSAGFRILSENGTGLRRQRRSGQFDVP